MLAAANTVLESSYSESLEQATADMLFSVQSGNCKGLKWIGTAILSDEGLLPGTDATIHISAA